MSVCEENIKREREQGRMGRLVVVVVVMGGMGGGGVW